MSNIALISPHYDDIVFSLGGLASSCWMQAKFYYITVFGQTCYLKNSNLLALSPQQVRNREDLIASQKLKANRITLGIPDASMVNHTENSEIFSSLLEERFDKAKIAIENIIQDIRPSHIFCPLGIGGHIDHISVFKNIKRLEENQAYKIYYYEDLPYSYKIPPDILEKIIRLRIGRIPRSFSIEITSVIKDKENLINIYKSQLESETCRKIISYAKSISSTSNHFCERVWN